MFREYPELFTGGEFSAKYEDQNSNKEQIARKIIGLKGKYFITRRTEMLVDRVLVSNAKLIARPIADMTGKEIDQFLFPAHRGDGNYTEIKQDLVRMANEGTLAFGQAKKMLKRGVYPGPQSHFGDTVIDSRTLKTTA